MLIFDSCGDTVGVFRRDPGGDTLTFRRGVDGEAVDEQHERPWSVRGVSVDGSRLEPFPHFGKLFWFSWANFNPDTKVATH